MRGYRLFNDPDKANCGGCHISQPTRDGLPPLFTRFPVRSLGWPRNAALTENKDPQYFDLGVCGPIRNDFTDQTQFWRHVQDANLAQQPPCAACSSTTAVFHTLQEMLDFYNFRDTNPEKIYPRAADGTVQKYNDIPVQYQANVDVKRSALQSASRRNAGNDGTGRSRHHRIPEDPDDGYEPAKLVSPN